MKLRDHMSEPERNHCALRQAETLWPRRPVATYSLSCKCVCIKQEKNRRTAIKEEHGTRACITLVQVWMVSRMICAEYLHRFRWIVWSLLTRLWSLEHSSTLYANVFVVNDVEDECFSDVIEVNFWIGAHELNVISLPLPWLTHHMVMTKYDMIWSIVDPRRWDDING
jgi:hypothetical protein